MSRRKLSSRDFGPLTRGTPIGVRYPPGGGRPELPVPTTMQRRRQQKGEELTHARVRGGTREPHHIPPRVSP